MWLLYWKSTAIIYNLYLFIPPLRIVAPNTSEMFQQEQSTSLSNLWIRCTTDEIKGLAGSANERHKVTVPSLTHTTGWISYNLSCFPSLLIYPSWFPLHPLTGFFPHFVIPKQSWFFLGFSHLLFEASCFFKKVIQKLNIYIIANAGPNTIEDSMHPNIWDEWPRISTKVTGAC